jgi:tetratricopeptide (TPR) repeat protein
LHELRRQMDKDNDAEIDTDLGFEICQRYGIPLIITGSFIKAGDIFASDVKVMDVAEKTILASASSRGEGINSLIEKQIDELGMQIVNQMGYSSREFTQEYKPVKIATTNSMDAYNFYVKANEHGVDGAEKKRLLELAIGSDSTFASAYIDLARFYENDTLKMAGLINKARTYAKNVPEKERLLIESKYYRYFEHNSSKAIELLENAIQKYPTDGRLHLQLALYYHGASRMNDAFRLYRKTAELEPYLAINWNQLGYLYADEHQYDQALACLEKYAELAPGHPNPLDSMGDIYLEQGDLDKAIERYRKAMALGWDIEKAGIAYTYALKEEYGESIRSWQSCDDCWGTLPDFKYFISAFYYFFQGRHHDAYKELDRIADIGYRTEYLVIGDLFKSWISYEKGSYSAGLSHLNGT